MPWDHTHAAACRSCGAPVVWLTIRPGGKRMPVDLEPTPEGTVLADLEAGAGIVLRGAMLAQVRDETPGEPLYRSHFATCPHADQWRKK